jgi:hypothetical protein
MNLVVQTGELSGQVKEVDPLPAGIHTAVVHEEADPHAALPPVGATERSRQPAGKSRSFGALGMTDASSY